VEQGTMLRAEIDNVRGQVTGLSKLNPTEISSAVSLVKGINLRVQSLEGR